MRFFLLFVFVAFVAGLAPRVRSDEDISPKFVDDDRTLQEIEADLSKAEAREFKPVGTSSIVFRVRLRGGAHKAAFRPATIDQERGANHVIASYRIAKALGMNNVPPAVWRCFPRTTLERYIRAPYERDLVHMFPDMVWNENSETCGALVHWIPKMREQELDDIPTGQWRRWLSREQFIPSDRKERSYARDVSMMLLYDFLIGNWDRHSGSNLSRSPNVPRLFLRDHNHTFEELSEQHYERLLTRVRRVERFDINFVDRLVELDRTRLELLTTPFLTTEELRQALDRRETLLSYIGAIAIDDPEKGEIAANAQI